MLIDAGAKPNLEDLEGNTALHVKCYGETGQPSELGAIQLLLDNGAKLTARNNRVMVVVFAQKISFSAEQTCQIFYANLLIYFKQGNKA